MRTAEEIHQELLQDPEVRQIYDQLEPEFLLAKSLIELRRKKQLTQNQLAKKLRTTQSAVARLESGKIDPKVSSLVRVARAMGMELEIRFV